MVDKLFPELFLKNKNWAYLWINILKFYTVCFYCMRSWRLSKYIKAKLQTTCFYLIKSIFEKEKEVWAGLLVSFSAWFLKENTYLALFYYLSKFHCLVVFTSWHPLTTKWKWLQIIVSNFTGLQDLTYY